MMQIPFHSPGRHHVLSLFTLSSCLFVIHPIALSALEFVGKQHKTIEMLYDFEDEKLPEDFHFTAAKGDVRDGHLELRFESADNDASLLSIRPQTPWNWSEMEDFSIAFDLANPGEVSTYVYLDVQDGDGSVYTRAVSVPVGGFHTYYAKMDGQDLGSSGMDTGLELNFRSGMRNNPATWTGYGDTGFVSLWGKKRLNRGAIRQILFRVEGAIRDKALAIDNIRLIRNPMMDADYLNKIVDAYGQNAKDEFAGKIHSDAELLAQRDQELKTLKETAPMNDRGRFSGWKDGPKLTASGYFRTEKVNGKWSLVTPDGYLYFATGLDVIRLANSSTITGYDFDPNLVQQREASEFTPEDSQGLNSVSTEAVPSRRLISETRAKMFEWLPDYKDQMAKHFGYRREVHSGVVPRGEVYSFYSANLERKYGELGNYLEVWRQVTVDRMLNWGFTSLGNWADPSFYHNQRIPFFANGWIIGDFKTVSSGNDFWAPLPDVYDPLFEERAMATLAQVAREVQDSPWCVGVFVDNEKSFGRSETDAARLGIVIHTLRRNGRDVPTKAEFTRLMKAKYGTIGALNEAWNTELENWESFDSGFDSTLKTDLQKADYSSLLHAYACRYFEIVANAVKRNLPHHLYLGARFPDWGMPIEVVRAAAKYVDVVSFNSYKEGLPLHKWAFLESIDKPCIIGEFHFGASDSGLFHPGLIHAADQQDRARMYVEYMQSVIDNPYFVGAHWFQYLDSPITGRAFDGENYNVGFVSVVPYETMVEAAKTLHRKMYLRKYGDEKQNR